MKRKEISNIVLYKANNVGKIKEPLQSFYIFHLTVPPQNGIHFIPISLLEPCQ